MLMFLEVKSNEYCKCLKESYTAKKEETVDLQSCYLIVFVLRGCFFKFVPLFARDFMSCFM